MIIHCDNHNNIDLEGWICVGKNAEGGFAISWGLLQVNDHLNWCHCYHYYYLRVVIPPRPVPLNHCDYLIIIIIIMIIIVIITKSLTLPSARPSLDLRAAVTATF